jgi:hypothetical protein
LEVVVVERQEIYCHACELYVQFDMDLELDGNHVLECPNCGHEHCRVVRDGRITGERWAQRNGPTIPVYTGNMTSSSTSYSTNTYQMTGNSWTTASWMNMSSGSSSNS